MEGAHIKCMVFETIPEKDFICIKCRNDNYYKKFCFICNKSSYILIPNQDYENKQISFHPFCVLANKLCNYIF